MKLAFQLESAHSRRRIRAILALLLIVSVLPRGRAQTTWTGAGGSGNWSDGANWSTSTAPGTNTSLVFGSAARTTNAFDLGSLQLAAITYQATAPNFFTVIAADSDLTLNGAGIVNSSATTAPTWTVSEGASLSARAELSFTGSASAGNARITTEGAAEAGYGGRTSFHDYSSAGTAVLTNSQFGGARAGTTVFDGHSTAANATLIGYGGAPGSAEFLITGDASGGSAVVQMGSGGSLNISTLNGSGTTVGSIAGSGLYRLGTKTLTTGSLNTNTEVSGFINGGSLTKVGTGTLTLSGDVDLAGTMTVSGGAVTISGGTSSGTATVVAPGATLNLTSASEMNLGATGVGATATSIGGTVNYSGSGNLVLGTTTQTTATGSFNAINASTPDMTITGGTFNNAGTFTKSGTGAVVLDTLAAFNNTATVAIDAGILVLHGTTLHNTGTAAVNGSGVLVVRAGGVLFNEGILNFASNPAAPAQAVLTGGTLSNGLLGTINWTSQSALQFGGGTIVNLGQFNAVANDGMARQLNGGTFTNIATFNKTGSGELQLVGPTEFNNSGAVNVNAGTLSTTQNYTNTNTGRTVVAAGATMGFSGYNALVNSGVVTVNGTAAFAAGLYAFNSGSVIDGAGTASFSSATIAVAGTSILAVAQSNWTGSGAITGTGMLLQTRAFNLTETLQIDTATFRNTGTTTVGGAGGNLVLVGGVFQNDGTLNFARASGTQLGFVAGTLTNALGGTVNWTGAGILQVGGGTLANAGQFNAVNNSATATQISGGVFSNTGTVTKTGTGEARLLGLTGFNNTGTVNVNAGTLSTDQNFTNSSTGRTTVATGATITFGGMNALVNSGVVTLNGTGRFSAGYFELNSGSIINGAGTANFSNLSIEVTGTNILGVAQSNWTGGGVINGTGVLLQTHAFNVTDILQIDAATFRNTGTTTVGGAAGILVIAGGGLFLNEGTLNFAKASGSQLGFVSGSLINATGGTVNWTGAGSISTYAGTFANVGQFNAVANDATVRQISGGSFNNTGTFTKSGTGEVTLGNFTNSGTVNLNAGKLSADQNYTNNGQTIVASGTTMAFGGFNGLVNNGTVTLAGTGAFTGGVYALNNGSVIDGTGTANFSGAVVGLAGTSILGVTQSNWSGGLINGTGVLLQTRALNVTGGMQIDAATFRNTGITTVSGASGQLGITGGGAFQNEGTLTLAGTSTNQVAIMSGTLVNATGGTVNLTGNAGVSGPGTLANAGTFNKSGTGIQTIDRTHVENTGNLNIQAGALQLANLATYTQSAGNLNIAAGALLDVLGTEGGAVFNGGAIHGNGTLLGDSSFNSGSLIAPGNSIGRLDFVGDTIWGNGASMQLELLRASNVTRPGIDNDFVTISGSLQLPTGGTFTLMLAGLAGGGAIDVLNRADSYNWTIATAEGGIFGFTADAFSFGTAGVTNAAGIWSVFQSGNSLMLGFTGVLTPVPEPTTYAAAGLAVCAAFAAHRRWRRTFRAAAPSGNSRG